MGGGGSGQPRILNPRIRRSTCIQDPITTHFVLITFKEVVRITVLDTKIISQNKKNTFCERTKYVIDVQIVYVTALERTQG